MTENGSDNPEEEEIYQTDACKVFIKKTGDASFRCKKGTENIEVGDLELNLLQGISELAKSSNKDNEKTQNDESSQP